MQTMTEDSLQGIIGPGTPSRALATMKGDEMMHQIDRQNDLPSPPASLSKALSLRSIDDGYDKNTHAMSPSSHLNGQDQSPSTLLKGTHPAPPSPPPSTHSSEDHLSSIRPSYFYPQPSDLEATGSNSTIQADDAPGIPVFEPTWEEFQDFYTFCQRIDEWGMKTGIVKIIPPREWIESLPRLDGKQGSTSSSSKGASSDNQLIGENMLSQVRIKNSIEQIFTPAGSGSWRQSNVVHPARVLNAKQWADLCFTQAQKGPEMSRMKDNAKRSKDDGAEEDGVRTRSGRGNRAGASSKSSSSLSSSVFKRKRSSEAEKSAEEGREDATMNDLPALEDSESISKAKLKMADRTTQQEWDAFDYVEGWCQEAGQDCIPQDWNPSVCKAIESEYWRGLNFGKAPMYGADLKGTLFTSATRHWNVGCLDNILTRLRLRRKLPGVTTPYLYFGMWRATFAWHVEDMDLYSINYIHFGAPKQWYSIRQSDRQRFELAMAGAFPGDSARCRHFMRHKSYLASPAFLAATAGIKPLRLVQKAQEFVITYPYGYHSGFNLGYNCAESVNFALESWLDIGRKAGYCDCANDSVKMDVDAMLEESKEMQELDRKREERDRRREAEEKMLESEEQRLEARRAKERERRKARKEEQARLEALGIAPSKVQEDEDADDSMVPASKKARTQALPCIFCPSTIEEDLVVIPYPHDEAGNARKPVRRAHRLCACFLPETWVAPNPKWVKGSKEPREVVMGFEGIEKARWSIKCQSCLDPHSAKKGAKVQCTFGKCSRTTHVSCALYVSSGWMVDMLADEAADILEGKTKTKVVAIGSTKGKAESIKSEDTGYLEQITNEENQNDEEEEATRIVVLCRSHNPREREREAQRRAQILIRCVKTLTTGQTIKIRTGSGVWETLLQEVKWAEDESVEGEIVVDGEQAVKWSKVLFEADVVKKAEEEQSKHEEEMVVDQAEVSRDTAACRKNEGTELTSFEKEKEVAKMAEKEAKEVAKRAKEEERQAKEVIKLQKKAEREAKAIEREAKAKAKEEKRVEREAKLAKKMVRAAEVLAGKQSQLSQSGQTVAPNAAASIPSGLSEFHHIRQWKPDETRLAPRPVLPAASHTNMNRTLAPIPPSQSMSTYVSSTGLSSNGYPPYLATYQNRYQQYPINTLSQSYPTQHLHQHQQIAASIPHPQYSTPYRHQVPAPSLAFHQQQGGYNGSYYPPPPQSIGIQQSHTYRQQPISGPPPQFQDKMRSSEFPPHKPSTNVPLLHTHKEEKRHQ